MRWILVVCLLLVAGIARADLADTQGRVKVGNLLNQMVNVLEGAKESGGRIYQDIKVYITDYPGQFSDTDRTKLNALQSQLTTIQNDINTFITSVETDFPGIK